MDQITIKAFLQRQGNILSEVRRFPFSLIPSATEGSQNMFSRLTTQIDTVFPGVGKDYSITWKDFDGDYVLMTSTEELQDAISEAKNSQLNIYITDKAQSERAETEPFTALNQQGCEVSEADVDMETPEARSTTQKESAATSASLRETEAEGKNQAAGPEGGEPTKMHYPPSPSYFLPPPPPPHFIPPPPPPPFPNAFPWAFPMGAGPIPEYPGPTSGFTDPVPGFPGPMPSFFGPMGMHQGPSAPTGAQDNLPDPGINFCGGIRSLISKVPIKQRQWAKNLIKLWRQKHLEDNSSTGGAEDQPSQALSMEESGVTQAYVDWMEEILPKVLKEGCRNTASLTNSEISVPMEFQKWCLWFLKWHTSGSGLPKQGPRVRFDCHPMQEPGIFGAFQSDETHHKEMKATVPLKFRTWAKSYITQWRQDHVINRQFMALTSSSNSESDDAEESLPDVIDIPEDYRKWMDKFLSRWHSRKGIKAQGGDDTATGEEKFQDTVPMEFRRWVRCYMNRHHKKSGKHAQTHTWHGSFHHRHGPYHHHHFGGRRHHHHAHHHHMNPHHQAHHHHMNPQNVRFCHGGKKWMKKLQRKWLEDAWQEDASSLAVNTSSGSDSSTDEEGVDQNMAASFQHMCLDPSMNDQQTAATGFPTHPAAAHFPPHIQHFMMMKMMKKMQAKQMKMAKKQAKQDAKEIKKAMKSKHH